MKKIKIGILSLIFIAILFISNNVFGSNEVTQKLYQDIYINSDGSITVKEAAVLEGEYNGRSREIEYINSSAVEFTGIYANFAGNTDIYNGTQMSDIKIYDISQQNFNSIDDINREEKVYKEVESASNGKYGVYTTENYKGEYDFKIYCPSKKKKVFCMEYKIYDVVVVHNDVAELYWNVLGDNYREDITDFQVRVHLPGPDDDLRVWTHGPLSGNNKIIDNKTVLFTDRNVDAYNAETIRIIFDKKLVPNGTKKSNVNAKEHILKYEEEMANAANYERAQEKYNVVNKASQYVLDLEEYPSIYNYNLALKQVNKITDDFIKTEYLQRIEKMKNEVNQKWKKDIQDDINYMRKYNYRYLSEYRLENLEEEIDKGFDESAKGQFRNAISEFKSVIDKRNANTRMISTIVVWILYILATILIIYKLIKLRLERKAFKGKYFRDFPSEIEPYELEYLMKRKNTNTSISATILNLITKKIIKIEENPNDKDNTKLILLNNEKYTPNKVETIIIDLLFKTVGKNNECYLEDFKNYGKIESRAKRLRKKIDQFNKEIKEEVKTKGYFKTNALNILFNIVLTLIYIVCFILSFSMQKGLENGLGILTTILVITTLTTIYYIVINKDKNRSKLGKEEYSRWLAHKRFLEHFSLLKERDLPEIQLWEKYLVTATVLGCADKVQERMKIYIVNNEISDTNLLLVSSINNNIVKSINRSVNTSINTANSTISVANASSGGGYGGGSSFGGGGRWPEVAVEVVSNIK